MHLTRNPIDPKKHGQGNELERNQDAQQTGDAASGGDEVIKETEGESIQIIGSPRAPNNHLHQQPKIKRIYRNMGKCVPDNGEEELLKQGGVKNVLSRGK